MFYVYLIPILVSFDCHVNSFPIPLIPFNRTYSIDFNCQFHTIIVLPISSSCFVIPFNFYCHYTFIFIMLNSNSVTRILLNSNWVFLADIVSRFVCCYMWLCDNFCWYNVRSCCLIYSHYCCKAVLFQIQCA